MPEPLRDDGERHWPEPPPPLGEAKIARIASAVATTRAYRLNGAIVVPVSAQARRQAEAFVAATRGEYTVRVGRVARGGYLLSDIQYDPTAQRRLACLYAASAGAGEGTTDDLVLLPNRRPVRASYALNAAEKAC